jgi:hypothetical protein
MISKRKRDQIINDYLFGIEDPEYFVKQKNDGGWLVKKRRPKSVFPKPKPEKEPKQEPESEPEPKPKPLYDDVSLDEIAQRLLDKINLLRNKKEEPKPEEEYEEEDIDEKKLDIPPEPEPKPAQPQPAQPIEPEPEFIYPTLRRRNVRLY